MLYLTFATGSSGCGPTSGYLRSLNACSNVTATKVLAPHQRIFSDSLARTRRASISYCVVNATVAAFSPPSPPTLLIDCASQFDQKGLRGSPRLIRVTRCPPWGSSPAKKSAPFDSRPRFGRPIRGERMANPAAASIEDRNHLGNGGAEK